jgi:uncharacterized membrane protein
LQQDCFCCWFSVVARDCARRTRRFAFICALLLLMISSLLLWERIAMMLSADLRLAATVLTIVQCTLQFSAGFVLLLYSWANKFVINRAICYLMMFGSEKALSYLILFIRSVNWLIHIFYILLNDEEIRLLMPEEICLLMPETMPA